MLVKSWLVIFRVIVAISVVTITLRRLRGLISSVVGHRSIAPGFNPRLAYIRRVFHLSLHLITFGAGSTNLGYLVNKIGHKTATFLHL